MARVWLKPGTGKITVNGRPAAKGALVTLQSLTDAAFDYGKKAFDIGIGLVSTMVLFLGLMKVGEAAGIAGHLRIGHAHTPLAPSLEVVNLPFFDLHHLVECGRVFIYERQQFVFESLRLHRPIAEIFKLIVPTAFARGKIRDHSA